MDNINYNNYDAIDEEEKRKEDEKQIKEIQALIINELNEIELDDDDNDDDDDEGSFGDESVNDNFERETKINDIRLNKDDSRYEITSQSSDSNDKENDFLASVNVMNGFVPNWTIATLPPFYDAFHSDNKSIFPYKYPQTNNNCLNGLNDSSINWEISLHDEMGIPQTVNSNQVFTDKATYYTSANNEQQKVLLHEQAVVRPTKVMTRDVAVECIPTTQRELDNLELLYSARGKRIEQLQQELDGEKEKRLKETRILNHKIILLESEQKNESNIMRRANEELDEQRKIIASNNNVISMQNSKIEELEYHINQLKEKVESCNIIIEGLNEQLTDLTSNSAVSRNNQKQAELLDCINRQFDTDSYRLKTEIQRLSERVDEKVKHIIKLETLMDEQTENHRVQKSEWKAEVDQLIGELEDERRFRKELETSISQEKIDQLKNQISDLNLGKSLAEDMNEYLQEQVAQLSHQLVIYEQSLNVLARNDTINNSSFLEVNDSKNEHKRGFRGSCPILTSASSRPENKDLCNIGSEECSNLRKQIFTLINRSSYLTNRLFDVRKTSLETKGNLKRLQKTIDDQNETIHQLQSRCIETEERLKSLQSGEETSMEKQQKIAIESLELVKENLELQCKTLQNQLKQANDTIKDFDSNLKRLEDEFREYKKMAEEDKMACIEEVKNVCSNHYDNLRQQLEQSWLTEKELLMDKEKHHRDQILQDLSDAVKEVDYVKSLYLQLSQQQSDEESNRTNWNDWLMKKLEEQKRSLNQQFKKDQEANINEMKIKHQLETEKLLSQINQNICKRDQCEGSFSLELESIDHRSLEIVDKYVQVDIIIDESDQIDKLKENINQLETLLKCREEECGRMKKAYEILNEDKQKIERENIILLTKITTESSSHKSPTNRNSESVSNIPNIIRSTTPQLVFATKRKNEIPFEIQSSQSNLQHQFNLLKGDLILQLSKISHSLQSGGPISSKNSSVSQSRQTLLSSNDLSSETAIENVKEQLYSFVLEGQARAASTLQQELEKSQIYVRNSLLENLRQLIPITLSVDGQLLDIDPTKIKSLIEKIVLMLDHLQENDSPNHLCQSSFNMQNNISNSFNPFSFTSTPRNHKSSISSDIQTTKANDGNTSHNDSWSSFSRSSNVHRFHPKRNDEIHYECKKLQNEIAQLSNALNKSNDVYPLSLELDN